MSDVSTAEARHPAWCDPQHCFVTDEGVRVHEQAPTHWEGETAPRSVLRHSLSDDAPTLTDDQLRTRLGALADRLRAVDCAPNDRGGREGGGYPSGERPGRLSVTRSRLAGRFQRARKLHHVDCAGRSLAQLPVPAG